MARPSRRGARGCTQRARSRTRACVARAGTCGVAFVDGTRARSRWPRPGRHDRAQKEEKKKKKSVRKRSHNRERQVRAIRWFQPKIARTHGVACWYWSMHALESAPPTHGLVGQRPRCGSGFKRAHTHAHTPSAHTAHMSSARYEPWRCRCSRRWPAEFKVDTP
jgi:hypothetical protein